MPEEKSENRFIKFLERNRKIFLPFKYFVYLVGIVVIILVILEFVSQAFLEEELLEADQKYLEYSYYHPYLDFIEGYHETINSCKDMSEDPLLIYAFGGSTMRGWPHSPLFPAEIPSYISRLLCKKEIPVEVKNFGIGAYINTQEIIHLFLKLEDDEVPDIVVFYDGANDISFGGHSYRTPQAYKYFSQKMNYRASIFPNLKEYLGRRFGKTDSSLILEDDILNGYFSKFQLSTDGLYGEKLYEKVMKIYLNNVKIVRSMEEDWGFKSFFYWQPTLYDKIGSLSDEEEVSLRKDFAEIERIRAADPIVTEFLNNAKYVRDLREVFGNRSDTVFVDFCHILPDNNKIIAEKMVEDIMKYLEESDYYEQK